MGLVDFLKAVAESSEQTTITFSQTWLHGLWEMAYDPDGDKKDWMYFDDVGTFSLKDEKKVLVRGYYTIKEEKVIVAAEVRQKIVEIVLTVSANKKKLYNDSGAYYTRKQAIEAPTETFAKNDPMEVVKYLDHALQKRSLKTVKSLFKPNARIEISGCEAGPEVMTLEQFIAMLSDVFAQCETYERSSAIDHTEPINENAIIVRTTVKEYLTIPAVNYDKTNYSLEIMSLEKIDGAYVIAAFISDMICK